MCDRASCSRKSSPRTVCPSTCPARRPRDGRSRKRLYIEPRMAWKDNFSTLFELLPIGAYRIDARTGELRANNAMVRIFGFKNEEEMRAREKAEPQGWYVNPKRRAQFHAELQKKGSVRDFVPEMR